MQRSQGMVLFLLLSGLQGAMNNTHKTNHTAGSKTEERNSLQRGTEEPVAMTTSAASLLRATGASLGAGTSNPTQPSDDARASFYTPAAPEDTTNDSATSTGGTPTAPRPGDSSTVPRVTTTTTSVDAPDGSSPGTTLLTEGSTSPSAAPSDSPVSNGGRSNKGGVIFGVILGTILGFVLFGLIGYFICGKKSSESFSHRRLYDDTRIEPVLPLDVGFAGTRCDKASVDKAAEGDAGCPGQDIAMDDMMPPLPSE